MTPRADRRMPFWLPRAGLAVTIPLALVALAYAGLLVAYNGAFAALFLGAAGLEPRDYRLAALFLAADVAAAFALWAALAALLRFARAARGRPSRATWSERAGLALAALYFGTATADAVLRRDVDPASLAAVLAPAALSLAALVLVSRLKDPA